jgi:hypothetical protein
LRGERLLPLDLRERTDDQGRRVPNRKRESAVRDGVIYVVSKTTELAFGLVTTEAAESDWQA